VLSASDGSQPAVGQLNADGVMGTGSTTFFVSFYYAAVSGLHPTTNYTISFRSLTISSIGVPAGCVYTPPIAGSFITAAQ
jgi:hypothetical protein